MDELVPSEVFSAAKAFATKVTAIVLRLRHAHHGISIVVRPWCVPVDAVPGEEGRDVKSLTLRSEL